MPAFTFEKLSPPVDRAPPPLVTTTKKHRGIIVQLLDRLTEAKLERSAREFAEAKQAIPRKK